MSMVKIIIDEVEHSATEGTTIIEAAHQAGVYIPHICSHPDLSPRGSLKPADAVYRGFLKLENQKTDLEWEGCQLCVVEIEGQEGLHRSCNTPVTEGMVIYTATPEAQAYRQERLMLIMSKHPHACLDCAQKEGCARFPCSMNVAEPERCCWRFGNCEIQQVAEYVGIKPETPRYLFEDIPVINDEPQFERDYNLCIGCTRCVRVCREVRGIEALDFVFDDEGRVLVGSVGPGSRESACKFCTACVQICPTGALRDKEEYSEPPCQTGCPAGIDVARYVRLVGEGKNGEATAVIREKVPFPKVLGYICPHDCEIKCRRGELNEPIAIRTLKRYAAENDDGRWKTRVRPAAASGKKIAIVGSGPAGLTAAYYLARLGHSVTVFEAASQPGGIMWSAIPRFLLPQEVLDEEIGEILAAGVELKLDRPVEDVSRLLGDGYDAVLLAIGLQQGRKLPIPGNEEAGVLTGLEFLRDVAGGKEVKLGDNVLVLGGGGVACDVARTARRLGASHVAMACLEDRETMLAPEDDIRQTIEEGVYIHPARSFTRIICEEGAATCVECLDVTEMRFDENSRLHLETRPDSEHTLDADTVIFATGQGLDRRFTEANGIKLTPRGIILADGDTMETSRRGVFASGDAVSGPASVVEAVHTGRKAAVSIDKYLGGEGLLEEQLTTEKDNPPYMGREEDFYDRARVIPSLLPAEERVKNYQAVEQSLSAKQAGAEGGRCLRCDIRFTVSDPILPPRLKLWVDFIRENIDCVPESEGVYTLYDGQENVIYIKGAMNLRRELTDRLDLSENARYFSHEEEPMYTKRESQLLQQYIAQHGEMPEGNRELDDLF